MSRPYSIKPIGWAFLLCLLLFFCAPSYGEEKLVESKGPITVTSERLTADNKAHTALFEGSVVAKTETTFIYSDRMLVHYSDSGKVIKIEAAGHVKLIKGDRIITSDAATYYADDQERIVFIGEPRAMEGKNVVTGTKMTYFMKDDRSIVENSKVFMEKGSAGQR
jgi:lipopolysaccharide export system protein LptA